VFVLADVFEVPYAEIATTVGRSAVACRQIASRARRRLRPDKQPYRIVPADRELLNGLLNAVASGDVNGVVARLAPDVVCITDGGPERRAARRPVVGSRRVARFLINLARRFGHALAIRPALVGGSTGVILSAGDVIEQVMAVESEDGVITSIYFVGNPDKLTSVCDPLLIE